MTTTNNMTADTRNAIDSAVRHNTPELVAVACDSAGMTEEQAMNTFRAEWPNATDEDATESAWERFEMAWDNRASRPRTWTY